jgi:HEAT repeat protein
MEENENLLKRLLKSFQKQEGLDELLLMAEHRNGFKRENAVRRLGMLGNPVAIPKLIVRVNDWVPQVRIAAKEALNKLMTPKNAKAFAESLPDLFHLKTCGRDNHARFISDVLEYLLKDKNVECIKEATLSVEPKVARIAVRLCFDYALLGREELVSRCLSHSDVLVRNMAADHLREFSGKTLDALLKIAIKDPFMPIRREAFQIYLRNNPEHGQVIANAFLFDRHISIRELAITHQLRNGVNVQGVYSSVVSDATQGITRKKYSILGLGYLGAKEKVSSITKNMSSESPGIRRSVIQATVQLIGEASKSILVTALGDPSPSVSKASYRLITKLKLKFDSNEINEAIDIQGHSHTLELVASAMKKSNKWERLIFLLKALSSIPKGKSSKDDIIQSELVKWDADFNRTSSQPSNQQIKMINQAYSNCSNVLNDRQKRSIEFTLSGLKYNVDK